MGNLECCVNSSVSIEDQITTIFQSEKFYLKNFNQNKLLNKLVDVRINQEFYKKHIEEKIIPVFYEKKDNPYEKYHTELFNHILFFLKEKNNMYDVILFFYPFIDHTDEDVAKTFYSFIKYIYGQATLKNILDILLKYFKYLTREINNVIIVCAEDKKVSDYLKENNELIFNDQNISSFIAIKMFDILKKYGENEVVPCEYFESVINRINLGNFSKVRHLFYNQFGEK